MNSNRITGLLGLCKKAGKLADGEFQVTEALQERRARLVLVASDSSDNTHKRFHDKAAHYGVPVFDLQQEKSELGRALGQGERSVLAVCDEGLAGLIRQAIQQNS